MPLPLDRKAYADCFEIFDRALASKKGIRVFRESEAAAYYLRNRLNRARSLDAELNRRVYHAQPDHPLYGSSEYYKVIVLAEYDITRDRWVCVLMRNSFAEADIEEIEPWGDRDVIINPDHIHPNEEFDLAEDDT